MANEIIRPTQLPARSDPVASEVVPSDNGASVAGVTWADGVNAAVPLATQGEAEAGVINTKRMTPLTTKQAIDAQVPPKISAAIGALNLGSASQAQVEDFATAVQGAKADSAVQPSRSVGTGTGLTGGGDLSADRTISLTPGAIASLGRADSSVQTVNGNTPDGSGDVSIDAEFLQEQNSVTTAMAESFASTVEWVRTAGYAAAGDGGEALYKRALSEPSHAGKFQSADGAWWELASEDPHLAMFGGGSGQTGSNNAMAITGAATYLDAKDITRLRMSGDVTVTGLSKQTAANITFVGSGKLAGVYRKRAIPLTARPGGIAFPSDLIAPRHLSKLVASSSPIVVVIGDSTSMYSHDGGTRSDGLYGLLSGAILAAYPNAIVYNRSVGGATWDQMTSPPPTNMPWYSAATPTKNWITYVRDLNPDAVIFNFGQNNPANLSALDMKNMLDFVATWIVGGSYPNMVLVTPHSPSLGYAGQTEQQNADRDLAAGMVRTFAQFYGLGLIDIHRASCIARDGFDPRRAAILRSSTTVTPSDEGSNVYRAQAHGDFEHYRGRVQFNGSTWVSGSTDRILLSFGGGGADDGGGGDYIDIRKSATGTITWQYRAGKSGALVDNVIPTTDTGRAMPTAAISNLYFEVSDGVFSLYPTLDSYAEPIVQRRLWGYGRRKTTYVVSVGVGARITQAEFWPCEPKLSMPFVTDAEMYGTTPYFNGNGINHLSGQGSRDVLTDVIEGTRWR